LNGPIAVSLLVIPLTARCCLPFRPGNKPDRKRSPVFQRKSVLRPVLGLVRRRCPTAHSSPIILWIQAADALRRDLCDKVLRYTSVQVELEKPKSLCSWCNYDNLVTLIFSIMDIIIRRHRIIFRWFFAPRLMKTLRSKQWGGARVRYGCGPTFCAIMLLIGCLPGSPRNSHRLILASSQLPAKSVLLAIRSENLGLAGIFPPGPRMCLMPSRGARRLMTGNACFLQKGLNINHVLTGKKVSKVSGRTNGLRHPAPDGDTALTHERVYSVEFNRPRNCRYDRFPRSRKDHIKGWPLGFKFFASRIL